MSGAQRGELAIVHEWIQTRAGSEQVFEALAKTFPDADLFALSQEPSARLDVGNRKITTTVLDTDFARARRAASVPVMPVAWRGLGQDRYDSVITSHHAFAHSNRLAKSGRQLCYVHSPARYVWTPEIDSRGHGWRLAPARALLRQVDLRATRHVTAFAANSREVATRIDRFWKREAEVIPPPVRVGFFSASPQRDVAATRDYVLGVGRWVPYKNLRVVIEAASIAGIAVKIAGSGPDQSRIRDAANKAAVPVELIETPTDDDLRELYRNAAVLAFPTVEDFGMVPVEAQAAGTPVVALGRGGALDTVIDGRTGVLTSSVDPHEIAEGIQHASTFDARDCLANAVRFDEGAFSRKVLEWAGRYGVAT